MKRSFPIVRPEWAFLIIATVAGLFMAVANPPYQSPDEDAQFDRAYQLSEGNLIAQENQGQVGGWLPQCIYDAWLPFPNLKKAGSAHIHELLKEPFATEPRRFIEFKHTALYSPVVYAPAMVGVWAGRMTGQSALGLLYTSRITTFLCWLVIVFGAIRIIPVFKWVMVMIALMPMSVILAASVSADVMTNALAMLTTAVILGSALGRKDPVQRGEWIKVVAACVMLALAKQTYLLLALLTLMTPVNRFGSRKRKAVLCLVAIGGAIAANLIWLALVRNTVTVEVWANPHAQLMFVLSHPFKYAALLWQMLTGWGEIYLIWFVGTLGSLDVYLPAWISPTYLAGLIALALVNSGDEGRSLEWWERWLIVGTCVTTVILIMTSQYVSYSAPGAEMIRGIQGRYFIPLGVASLLAFYNRRFKLSERVLSCGVIIYCTIVLVTTAQTVIARYY